MRIRWSISSSLTLGYKRFASHRSIGSACPHFDCRITQVVQRRHILFLQELLSLFGHLLKFLVLLARHLLLHLLFLGLDVLRWNLGHALDRDTGCVSCVHLTRGVLFLCTASINALFVPFIAQVFIVTQSVLSFFLVFQPCLNRLRESLKLCNYVVEGGDHKLLLLELGNAF